jgi:hypothetical protein
MTISELIAALQANLATDGDRLVCVEDVDTNWHMVVTAVVTDTASGRVIIETEGYGGETYYP